MDINRRIGSYIVEREIGTGGMATVYLVRHIKLGSRHALKVLHALGGDADARLQLEGRLQANVAHPNIVRVTDMIDVESRTGLVMEYVPGPTLGELITRQALTIDETLALGAGVLAGLAAAHQAGFVHRDLKPSNILIDLHDDRLVPKIADFGLARRTHGLQPEHGGDPKTPHGRVMGTFRYMAPEQYAGAEVDHRADLWAMGCVLYEMVTHRPAFDFSALDECVQAVTQGRFTPIDQLAPNLPDSVLEAVRAALVVDRDQRVQSAAALREIWYGDRSTETSGLRVRAEMMAALRKDWSSEHESSAEVDLALKGVAPAVSETVNTWSADVLEDDLGPEARPNRWLTGLVGLALVVVALGWWGSRAQPVPVPDAAPVIAAPIPPVVETPSPVALEEAPTAPAPVVKTPPRPAPASAEEASATVEVTLTSVPMGVEIYVNGQREGITPLVGHPLASGRHEVRFRSAEVDSGPLPLEVGVLLPRRYRWRASDQSWSALAD